MPDARPLLLFFSSARSGPARRMESLLAHIARKERDRVRVVQVDLDERSDLAERLRVELAPTIVLVQGRTAVDRLVGRVSRPEIEALIARHVKVRPAAG